MLAENWMMKLEEECTKIMLRARVDGIRIHLIETILPANPIIFSTNQLKIKEISKIILLAR